MQILIIYLDDAMPTLGQSALRSIGWADEQMRKLDVLAGLGSQREVVAAADTTLVNLRLAHQNIDAATCRIDNSGQLPLWKLQMSLPASEVRAYEKLGKQRDSLQSIIERLQTKVDRLAAAPK